MFDRLYNAPQNMLESQNNLFSLSKKTYQSIKDSCAACVYDQGRSKTLTDKPCG